MTGVIERFTDPQCACVCELGIVNLAADPVPEVITGLGVTCIVADQIVEGRQLSRPRHVDVDFTPVDLAS